MSGEAETKQYLYQLTPVRPGFRPDPESMTPEEAAAAQRHYDYLKDATDRGQVLLAGSALDETRFGIVILEADSPDAARSFMENDPFAAEGVMRVSLHPFRIGLSSSRL